MRFLRSIQSRLILVVLTVWALAMVVPDLYRLVQPLGSFGFYADGDGLITDVRGPFPDETASPAWRAGLRKGDRLDLTRMRCIPINTPQCAIALATLGGLQLVGRQQHADLAVAATADKPARQIAIDAEARPFTWWVAAILPLDQLAAIAVILAAAWLVWTRPGRMTWGFFIYIIWFNPGQSFEFYAVLQRWPALLLAQTLAAAIAQGAGFSGLLQFALRVPQDSLAPRWRPIERALPLLAIGLAMLMVVSIANVFGYPTEMLIRASILSGFAVAAGALAILLARRQELPPADYQRLRWVIWGCLIGLPSLTLANIAQETSLLLDIWGNASPPDEMWDMVRLINGVLCLFVFEAVRRPLVVSVAVPLRRVTILGILLSAPTLLLHRQFDHVSESVRESVSLPNWMWLVIASFALFVFSRLHEFATHHANRFFNRPVARAGRGLGQAISRAQDFASIEIQLVDEVCKTLSLASASIFRKDGAVFRRTASAGAWDAQDVKTLEPDDQLLRSLGALRPFDVTAVLAERNHFPAGLARPVFVVPVANWFDCYAVALYGAHASGNDLNEDERATLTELAELAGAVWTKLDLGLLRQRIKDLEGELSSIAAKLTALPNPSPDPVDFH